jgi:uncharacterized cupredoxin-like copper-binding protein
MTAIFPSFDGWAGPGSMGKGSIGMMGRSGFGQGMMGGGFGQSQGMMGGGVGNFAPGMMGIVGGGMMGPGMMGVMSIRTDAPAAKAGSVTFEVINWSRSLVHEMVVVAVDGPDAALPYDYTSHQIVEEQVKLLAETDELEPNAREALTLDLAPGSYLLICNIPGHYGLGMQEPFTVTE